MITEIKNFKLIDFLKQDFELVGEYISILKHMHSRRTKKEIFDLTLGEANEIKKALDSKSLSGFIAPIALLMGCKQINVMHFKVIDFFGYINYLKDQILKAVNTEANVAQIGEINRKWEAIGGSDVMAKYKIYNLLDMLSDGVYKDYEYYLGRNYKEVLTVVKRKKEYSQLQSKISKMK